MEQKNTICINDIVTKRTKKNPIILARKGFQVPIVFMGFDLIPIEEFAIQSPNGKKFVLVRELDLKINRRTSFKERFIEDKRINELYNNRIRSAFFTRQEQKDGVTIERLIQANSALIQNSINFLNEKLTQKQNNNQSRFKDKEK